MTLATLFKRLTAEAEAGGSAFARLKQGATVRIRARGRRGVPVGDVEERTFRDHGHIPAHADRVAFDPTPDGWHYVSYTWEEFALELPLEELPPSL